VIHCNNIPESEELDTAAANDTGVFVIDEAGSEHLMAKHFFTGANDEVPPVFVTFKSTFVGAPYEDDEASMSAAFALIPGEKQMICTSISSSLPSSSMSCSDMSDSGPMSPPGPSTGEIEWIPGLSVRTPPPLAEIPFPAKNSSASFQSM